jgi:hypothetical protein
MRRSQKIIATVWTTILVAPLLYVSFAYSRLECGEYDPCSTGGPMPYAPVAILIATALTLAQAAFLLMLWRSRSEQ